VQLAPAGAAAGATLANISEQAAAAAAAAASQVAQDLPHLAQQMVEGHLKLAAGVLEENLPGIAQQLAEQPIKEQGGWHAVLCIGFATWLLTVWSWDCSCCATACWQRFLDVLSAQQMVQGHLKPAAGVLAEKMPGIAQQLAEQPLKEQGGWRVMLFCALGFVPSSIVIWSWDCTCCAAACWQRFLDVLSAQQVVEGHLKPAAGVVAEHLPGIAQQLAEQPIKEQGGWHAVLCIVFAPRPPFIAIWSWECACFATACWQRFLDVVGSADG
jgi:hypothetical protein